MSTMSILSILSINSPPNPPLEQNVPVETSGRGGATRRGVLKEGSLTPRMLGVPVERGGYPTIH